MKKDIKENLILRIKEIDDIDMLNEIMRLLNSTAVDEEVYITSKEQKSIIKKAQGQIENGNTIDGETADKQMDKWLDE